MKKVIKTIFNIALKVMTWLLVAFTVFMMVFTVITVTTVDKNERDIFGYKFYIVLTDSMSPSENNKDLDVHFSAGDIIIIQETNDRSHFRPGDVVSFISTNEDDEFGAPYGSTMTHMIREVQKDDDGKLLGYVTFGTNTGKNDESLVEPEYILGVYRGKLPGVGHFFSFVKTTEGYIICILVPFLLLILYNGINVIRLFRKYRKEQLALMQAEKDKIESERAENQRMMEELLALKAQLEKKENDANATTEPVTEETKEEAETPSEPASEEVPNEGEIKEEPASEESTEEVAVTEETEETESEDAPAEESTDENQ